MEGKKANLLFRHFKWQNRKGNDCKENSGSPVRIFTCSLSEGEMVSFLQSYIQQSCPGPHEMGHDMGVWAGRVTRELRYSHS